MTGFVSHPCGPRLYLFGRRIHHGSAAVAAGALALATQHHVIAVGGVLVALHDAGDFPWRDCDNHAPPQKWAW
jgi:hypothetical protein